MLTVALAGIDITEFSLIPDSHDLVKFVNYEDTEELVPAVDIIVFGNGMYRGQSSVPFILIHGVELSTKGNVNACNEFESEPLCFGVFEEVPSLNYFIELGKMLPPRLTHSDEEVPATPAFDEWDFLPPLPEIGETPVETCFNVEQLDQLLKKTFLKIRTLEKIHKKIVPLKQEKNLFIQVFSKFKSGMGDHHDFFEIFKSNQYLFILVSTSRNYSENSMVLDGAGHFYRYWEKYQDIVPWLKKFSLNLERKCPDNKLSLVLVQIDCKKMLCKIYHFGKIYLYSSHQVMPETNSRPLHSSFIEESETIINLQANEKIFIWTNGFSSQIANTQSGHNFYRSLKDVKKINEELFNKTFFQLSEQSLDEDFLNDDATLLAIEVDQFAIKQL